jgi:hypothetical protein
MTNRLRSRHPSRWPAHLAPVPLLGLALSAVACVSGPVRPGSGVAPTAPVVAHPSTASEDKDKQPEESSAPAAEVVEAEETLPEATLAEIEGEAVGFFRGLRVFSRYDWRDEKLAAAQKAGLSEAKALRWLVPLSKGEGQATASVDENGRTRGPLSDVVLGYLEHVGSRRSLVPLFRVAASSSFNAQLVLENVLERVVQGELAAQPACPPPTAGEIGAAQRELGDFLVIEADVTANDRLVARTLSAAERDDLAYLFAALAESAAPVGSPEALASTWAPKVPASSGRADPTFSPARLEALRTELSAAKKAGDLVAVQTSARAYLSLLGYPGPIRAEDEDNQTWGGPGFANVMRDLAFADELAGEPEEAGRLYRRANPGGGACGTSVGYRIQEQMQGIIRTAESRHQCRQAIAERLYGMDDASFDYGPKRLAEAGWDVPRLYRGALLTVERGAPKAELLASFSSLPRDLAIKASARLESRGNEAFADRLRAVRGYADTSFSDDAAGVDTLPRLLALTRNGSATVRAEALSALAAVAELTTFDPCNTEGMRSFRLHSTGRSERTVAPRNHECATKLSPTTQRAIAEAFLAAASDKSALVREEVAKGLGHVDVSAKAEAALLKLSHDRTIKPGWFHGSASGKASTPIEPVTEAAVEALKELRTFRADVAKTKREQAAYRREEAAEAAAAERAERLSATKRR